MMQLFGDIQVLAKHWRVCSYLAVQDVKSRFRRSALGVVWLVINQLAFSVGGGLIWANIFNDSPGRLIPFLTVSFALWGFIAGSITEGCAAFVVAHAYLKQLPLPPGIFIVRTLLTQSVYLGVGLVTAIVAAYFTGRLPPLGVLAALPGLAILLVYSYGAIGTAAYLGVRYRDLQHGFVGLFSLLFVISPVIYPAEVLIKKGLPVAIYGNPFASLLEIVRTPLLSGQLESAVHYGVAGGFALMLISLRCVLGYFWSAKVPMWT